MKQHNKSGRRQKEAIKSVEAGSLKQKPSVSQPWSESQTTLRSESTTDLAATLLAI